MSSHLPHDHGTVSIQTEQLMPKRESFDSLSDIMKLMSDSCRLRIFWLLCHGEECVINLSAMLDISSATASHHLKLLKISGLVVSRREGKEVYYTASKTSRADILHEMIEEVIEVFCPENKLHIDTGEYDSSAQITYQVHELITEDLKRWYTIEELSNLYHINQTTLKTSFKRTYGNPIASYMKECRISKAKELLINTHMRISEISIEVGYVNPSKFTQAFYSTTGYLPKEFRKKYSVQKD